MQRDYGTTFPFPDVPSPLPPFPAEVPYEATLAELTGWWLEVQCSCSTAKKLIPFRLMAARSGWSVPLGRAIARLQCKRCGQRPSTLVLLSGAAGDVARLPIT